MRPVGSATAARAAAAGREVPLGMDRRTRANVARPESAVVVFPRPGKQKPFRASGRRLKSPPQFRLNHAVFYDTFMSPRGCACITGASRERTKLVSEIGKPL